jgi:hypothetical protein
MGTKPERAAKPPGHIQPGGRHGVTQDAPSWTVRCPSKLESRSAGRHARALGNFQDRRMNAPMEPISKSRSHVGRSQFSQSSQMIQTDVSDSRPNLPGKATRGCLGVRGKAARTTLGTARFCCDQRSPLVLLWPELLDCACSQLADTGLRRPSGLVGFNRHLNTR